MEEEDFFEDKTRIEEARMTARAVRFERLHYTLWPLHCVLVHFTFCVMGVSTNLCTVHVYLGILLCFVFPYDFISGWYFSIHPWLRFSELCRFEVPC